ncbi:MAG: OsmC family protein [Pseudomonadota bacterium]
MSFEPTFVTFPGADRRRLSARLDLPPGPVRGIALLADCFGQRTDLMAARIIGSELARKGVGVLRLGCSQAGADGVEGAEPGSAASVADILAAVSFLREHHTAPSILIGHSLAGAAVLAAAGDIPEARAVATIGAPADVAHTLAHAAAKATAGAVAAIALGGQSLAVPPSLAEDAAPERLAERIGRLRKALLVLHAPLDDCVGIEQAQAIFVAARHPKSFVSLDRADHLLSNPADAAYAARVIAAWASHALAEEQPAEGGGHEHVLVSEIGQGRYQSAVVAGRHRLFADEPTSVGGDDLGPSPYDYLSIALGACKAITLRMYAARKGLEIGRISVEVRHGKVPVEHCADCGRVAEGRVGKIDRFECEIAVEGELAAEVADRLVEIAGKCPVHRTLEATSAVVTRLAPSGSSE